jgi:aldehyde dehydrogenase (NAD+)
MVSLCSNYINGKWVKEDSLSVNIHNPANLDELVSTVYFANDLISDQAIYSAFTATKLWRETVVEERIELITALMERIKTDENRLAEIITKENGKTLKESLAEINSGIIEANYQIEFLSGVLKRKKEKLEIKYEPLGIVTLITPWNFPVATILRKMVPALITGNTVILKPSEYTPLSAVEIIKRMEDLKFPRGVINLVLGDGKVGGRLVCSKNIGGISLTGSTLTGLAIKKLIVNNNTKLQAEMGGKNCVVVLKDADIENAARDIVSNGFACCGQWCTGTSKVVVQKEIADDLITTILDLTKQIKIGNGIDSDTDMGPLISEAQLNKTKYAVNNSEGAELLVGGKQPYGEKYANGYFFEPTVFKNVDPDSSLAQEEIFGPVLSIITANDMDDAVSIANNSKYGLSFSVYTNNEEFGERFVDKVDSGLCHINLPTAMRDSGLPLLGWKNSGYGIPESGRFALDFYTKTKAVYRK